VFYDGPPSGWKLTRVNERADVAPAAALEGPPGPVERGEVVIGDVFPLKGFSLPDPAFTDAGELGEALTIDGPLQTVFVTFGAGLEPMMHRDGHLAVGVVIDGRIELYLEETSVWLEQGDVVVNPGILHGWGTGDLAATLAFISIQLPPPEQSPRVAE
jgi:quercetin dioxygenase-like cupin family protein